MVDYLKKFSPLSMEKSMPSFFQTLLLVLTLNMPFAAFAHDMARQEEDTVKSLYDLGYVSNKKLVFTRQSMTDFYDDFNPLNPTLGKNKHAKNAKAFLKGVIDETADKFNSKKFFVTNLYKVLDISQPLELDITIAGFNPWKAPTNDQIEAASEILLKVIKPEGFEDLYKKSLDQFYEKFPFLKGKDYTETETSKVFLIMNSSHYKAFIEDKTWNMSMAISMSMGLLPADRFFNLDKNCRQIVEELFKRADLWDESFANKYISGSDVRITPFKFYQWTQDMNILTPRAFQEAFAKLTQ